LSVFFLHINYIGVVIIINKKKSLFKVRRFSLERGQ